MPESLNTCRNLYAYPPIFLSFIGPLEGTFSFVGRGHSIHVYEMIFLLYFLNRFMIWAWRKMFSQFLQVILQQGADLYTLVKNCISFPLELYQ